MLDEHFSSVSVFCVANGAAEEGGGQPCWGGPNVEVAVDGVHFIDGIVAADVVLELLSNQRRGRTKCFCKREAGKG